MHETKITESIIMLSIVTVLIVGLILWLKSVYCKRRQEVGALFRGQAIIMKHNFAHFYGLESIGYFQNRGNGVLVLTAEVDNWIQAVRREIKNRA